MEPVVLSHAATAPKYTLGGGKLRFTQRECLPRSANRCQQVQTGANRCKQEQMETVLRTRKSVRLLLTRIRRAGRDPGTE